MEYAKNPAGIKEGKMWHDRLSEYITKLVLVKGPKFEIEGTLHTISEKGILSYWVSGTGRTQVRFSDDEVVSVFDAPEHLPWLIVIKLRGAR